MTAPSSSDRASRRAALAKKRQSRRPSRLGTPAGAAPKPDHVFDDDAGFPGLLKSAWQRASAAPDLPGAVDVLLTLGGHVPPDVQLRALGTEDEIALRVLFGLSWREDRTHTTATDDDGQPPAFLGELGLTTSGRIVVRVPSEGPLTSREKLVGGVMRVPWSARALADYRDEMRRATQRAAEVAADCRRWLAATGPQSQDDQLEHLKEAALRTAPFVLYQEGRQYTNFRDRNTITGKTLWPGHPDCALSSLQGVPLELWSDNDVLIVVCLTLLVRSAGYARIEEANGTQLSLDHVAHLLERTRRKYNGVLGGQKIPPVATAGVDEVNRLAEALGERRRELSKRVQLYREIHGALMHKVECVARPRGDGARHRERLLCAHLRDRLPVDGRTLDELGANIATAPGWLAEPHGEFGTGLESLVYETVVGSTVAFDADFAMSRGMRSIPQLIRALRDEDYAQLTEWDLPEYFCCVVPRPEAREFFANSVEHLADTAWAISSRMQYNSWHFIAGNVPKVPVVVARDYFVPPTIPDVAFFSDQHHHGHVASRVRFSIRSPQSVEILGKMFNGFVDLRLLRCAGEPFDEQDLLAAHMGSGFIARATGLVAAMVADGRDVEVTAFDADWHWATINAAAEAAAPTPQPV